MFFCKRLLFIASFFPLLSFANKPEGKPLYFPMSLNNVQALPQKFEYSLRDAYRFLLGSRLIDTSAFHLTITPSPSSIQLDTNWPENLFEKGTLSFLNPSGVAIWSTPLRNKQSSLNINNASSLVTRLMNLTFFKYCISQYELMTGMEVCSPEMIVKGSGSKIRVETYSASRKPLIQINGRAVTPHGIVFLNDDKESLSFRAISASGAEFKMDTRRIKLEFLDVISLNDSLMSLTIKGPAPLAPASYKVVENDIWTVTLRKDRALIYIAGEGKVPLRQEFVVNGALPSEANRVYLDSNSPTKTYASNLELKGNVPQKGLPSSPDSSSDLAVIGNRFTWLLKNRALGQNKLSTLQVVDGQDAFTAGYFSERKYAHRFEISLGLDTADTVSYIGGEIQKWFETLPLLDTLGRQRFGLGALFHQDITGKSKTMLMELDSYIRLKPGLQFQDASPIFGIGFQHWTFESKSLQTLAPIIGWQGPFPVHRFKYFEWQEYLLRYSLPANKDGIKLKERIELKAKLYQPFKEDQKLRYGVGFYSEDVSKKKSGLLLDAAWTMIF